MPLTRYGSTLLDLQEIVLAEYFEETKTVVLTLRSGTEVKIGVDALEIWTDLVRNVSEPDSDASAGLVARVNQRQAEALDELQRRADSPPTRAVAPAERNDAAPVETKAAAKPSRPWFDPDRAEALGFTYSRDTPSGFLVFQDGMIRRDDVLSVRRVGDVLEVKTRGGQTLQFRAGVPSQSSSPGSDAV